MRLRGLEAELKTLGEICFRCQGSRHPQIACVSLDCPVRFARVSLGRKLEPADALWDLEF